MGDLIGTIKTSTPRKFWGLDSGQKGQFYLVSELNDATQTFEIKQHKHGQRLIVCPGADCAACEKGDEPEVRFAFTVFVPDTKKKQMAIMRYGKQGILKKLISRWEMLRDTNADGTAIKMKGDLFMAERASDGFSYELQFVGSYPDKVADIAPFTKSDVLAKLKAGDRGE